MPIKPFNIPIRVVFYQEESRWIAHCLEFDLLGDGETQQQALDSLAEAIEIQVAETADSGNIHNLFHPAPSEYWMKYALESSGCRRPVGASEDV